MKDLLFLTIGILFFLLSLKLVDGLWALRGDS